MTSTRRALTRGMSLIELLVVIAIMGLLAVSVLPALSTSAERNRPRVAATTLTSFMSKAQSKALGAQTWRGLWIEPGGPGQAAGLTLYEARVPEIYRGGDESSRATVSSGAAAGGVGLPGELFHDPTWLPEGEDLNRNNNLDSGEDLNGNKSLDLTVRDGDLVRFGQGTPLYRLLWDYSATPGRLFVELRPDLAQTIANTPLPPLNTPLPFELHRRPVPSGAPQPIPDGYGVDLRWSGFGPRSFYEADRFNGTNGYQPTSALRPSRFHAQPSNVALLFDAAGKLRECFHDVPPTALNVFTGNGPIRAAIPGTIFLLIGRMDRAGNDALRPRDLNPADDGLGANWQYRDSVWIAIDPNTGLARTFPPTLPTGTIDVNAIPSVYDSQSALR